MSGRPGSTGRRSPISTDYADDRDPAHGEKVPRCGACGMPDTHVLQGTWYGLAGRPIPGIRFPVCPACVAKYNGPQRTDTDELRVGDAAA